MSLLLQWPIRVASHQSTSAANPTSRPHRELPHQTIMATHARAPPQALRPKAYESTTSLRHKSQKPLVISNSSAVELDDRREASRSRSRSRISCCETSYFQCFTGLFSLFLALARGEDRC